MALIEIYNEKGQLVIDNETKVLTITGSLWMPAGTKIGWNVPTGSWASDWNIEGKNAKGKWTVNYFTNPFKKGLPAPNSEATWIKPLKGTSALQSTLLWGVAANSQGWIEGDGVEWITTMPLTPNDSTGYADCYSPAGELVWSVSALMKVPQIIEVFDLWVTRSIDLNWYPAHMKERLYYYPVLLGEFMVIEDESGSFSSYDAIQIYREGDIVYFGDIEGNPRHVFLMMAYIP